VLCFIICVQVGYQYIYIYIYIIVYMHIHGVDNVERERSLVIKLVENSGNDCLFSIHKLFSKILKIK
jgi:hypothetical protein